MLMAQVAVVIALPYVDKYGTGFFPDCRHFTKNKHAIHLEIL